MLQAPGTMLNLLLALLSTARSGLRSRRELVLENLALRQQLAVLGRRAKRPKLTRGDRAGTHSPYRISPRRRAASGRQARTGRLARRGRAVALVSAEGVARRWDERAPMPWA